MLLDLETSRLAFVSSNHMGQPVALQELYQCSGAVGGGGGGGGWEREGEREREREREE